MSKKKYCLNDLIEIAQSRNGICLSESYTAIDKKFVWQCHKKHIWESSFHSILKGTWCPFCAGKHISIFDMREFASSKGGKCLSEVYINNYFKLEWMCSLNHTWKSKPNKILSGRWCPYCSKKMKLSIESLQDLAKSRGGNCLSTVYKNNKTKIKWQCKDGHIWEAMTDSIKNQNQWCPFCRNKTEELCREIFQSLFNKSFPRIRPKWLLSPKNKPMELDGFNEELGIAFELNGPQHYSIVRDFNMTQNNLDYNIIKDKLKETLCNDKGIKLITIKAMNPILNREILISLIKDKLLEYKINLSS